MPLALGTPLVPAGVVEPLGNTMDVYFSTSDGATLVGRVKAGPIDRDSSVKAWLDADKMHLFAPGEYGLNLSLPQMGGS